MVSEPDVKYGRGNIRIFHSFEEMERAEILAVLQKPPIERLRDTVGLILRIYGFTREQLKKRRQKDNFKLVRYE